MDQNPRMDGTARLEPDPIHEKLRSDQERMEHLTKSFVAGLEQLGRDNTNLAIQLSKQHKTNVSMVNELNLRHMASVETHKKLDEALRVNNQLRAEILGYKSVNSHLREQYIKAQSMEAKLRIELDAAQNEVNRLKSQLDDLKRVTESPTNIYSQLWPHGIGNALPTPPLAAQSLSPPLALGGSNGDAFFNLPRINENKDLVGPSANHPSTMVLKPRPNGFVRGGLQVEESFARLKKNLAMANNLGGSSHTKVSDATQSDGHTSHSLREFFWPQATPIHQVKKTLDLECVPSTLPSAESTLTSKLNPFSREFVPAMRQSKENVPPPHKQDVNPEVKKELGSPSKKSTKTENLPPPHLRAAKSHFKKEVLSPSGQAPKANATMDTMNEKSSKAEAGSSIPAQVNTNAPIQPGTVAVSGIDNSRESLLSPTKAKDPSSEPTENVAIANAMKPLPPHLRGLPLKAAAQKLEPAATLASTSTAKTTDTLPRDKKPAVPEPESMKAWLDDLEQKSMGQSVLDERSNSTPSSPPGDKLIDLDNDDDRKSAQAETAPGFTPEALKGILHKTKSRGATPDSELQQTLESLLANIVSRPTKAQSEPDMVAIIQDLVSQYQNKQRVPASMEEAQDPSDDENDTTTSFKDPYLQHLSRGRSDDQDACTGHPNDSERGADIAGLSKEAFGGPDKENEGVSDLKARRPNPKSESSITADFLSAYNKKLLGVQSKYVKPTGTENRKPALSHDDQFFDPDYVAPKIIGTRKLGELLDEHTRSMVVSEMRRELRWDLWAQIEWKPVVKGGKTVYVL